MIGGVVHPTDLSPAPSPAFCHALCLAVAVREKPGTVHATPDMNEGHKEHFSGVGVVLDSRGAAETACPPRPLDCVQGGQETRSGDVAEVMSPVAAESDVGLVVLATEGRHGFVDAWRGSTTGRVVHGCGRPVFAVPAAR